MYYLNARMYDPVTARFMQEDTYTGQNIDPLSLNLYTYCHNEPLMYSDPTGHNENEVDDDDGNAGMTGTGLYGMPSDVYYNYYQYARVWESKTTKGQADAARKAYFDAQGYSETSKNLALDALLDTEFYDDHYEEARENVIDTMIASDKGNLTLTGIEDRTMRNIQKAHVNGQSIDIKTADSTLGGLIDYVRHDDNIFVKSTWGKAIRTWDVAVQVMSGMGGAILGTGDALGKGAHAWVDTAVACFETVSGDISAKEFNSIFENNMKTIRSLQYGYYDGMFEMGVGGPFQIWGALEYINNDTTYISDFTGKANSLKDDFLVNTFDLNREDMEDAKGIASTTMLLASLFMGLETVRNQAAINKGNAGNPTDTKINNGKSKPTPEGPKNSIYEQLNPDGTVKSRAFYDQNGKQFSRQDFDHTHFDKKTQQNYQPHEHNYSYNKEGLPAGKSAGPLPDGYNNKPSI